MKFLRCENCGSELVKEGENYLCNYCKRSYIDDSLEKAYNRLYENLNATVQGLVSEELLKQKMEQIAMHRQSLYKARTGLYSENEEVSKWSEEILKICADDVQANFYAIASKKRWAQLNAFMAKLNAREVSYLVEGFVDYLTNGRFIERCALQLSDLVARAFDANSEEYIRSNKKIAEAVESEKSGLFDVELSRDVFVAYSSKDKEKAYELVEYLEENDFSCFIAARNLAKGADAELKYNERLKKAIDNCQVFLLVSSKNSRSKNCDAYNIEMRYVKEKDISRATNPDFASTHYEEYLEKNRKRCKPRVEYLVDEYGATIYEKEVKKFFGGLTWHTELDGIVKTVFDYVENQTMEEDDGADFDKAAEAKKMEALIKEFEERQNELAKEQEEKRRRWESFKRDARIFSGKLQGYRGYDEIIEIPDGISHIGEGAFYLNSSLKTIIIPATVTKIEKGAFKECKNLRSVEIHSPQIEIEPFAFYNCPKLESVIIDGGKLSSGVFSKCKALEEVVLGKAVTAIGDSAFFGCISLREIILPNSITVFGQGVFSECKKLEKAVLPDSIKKLGNSTFSGCAALTEVVLPEKLTMIDKWAFENCVSLEKLDVADKVASVPTAFNGCVKLQGKAFDAAKKTEIKYDESKFEIKDGVLLKYLADEEEVSIPDGVIEVGEKAFEYKENLHTLHVPESLKKIGQNAFYWCKRLNKVTWAKNCRLQEFGDFSFACCHRLYSFEVPLMICSIERCAFSECDALVEVYNPSEYKINYEFNEVKDITDRPATTRVYQDKNGFVLYKGEKDFSLLLYEGNAEHIVIPEGVTEIVRHAFIFYSEYKSVLIPESVKKIGNGVFSVYKDEKPVIYARAKESPWGWKTDYPSWNHTDLPVVWGYQSEEELELIRKAQREKEEAERLAKEKEYQEQLEREGFKIKDGVLVQFKGKMTEVEIPENVTKIGENAFKDNTMLKKVSLHADVTELGNNAFSGCFALKEVCLAENSGLVKIGANAFNGCSVLSEINLDACKNLRWLGERAFKETALKEVSLPLFVTELKAGVFANAKSLERVMISKENKLTTVEQEAFTGCDKLCEIFLPLSVETIGVWAFKGCGALTISAGAKKRPKGWVQPLFGKDNWNPDKRPVKWGE
ncbi:MAG: leucine-rich repeat protein [Clostridia bacterium]|nr:leucine-rich repeat protein [Clostridia bacterium]